MQGRPPQQSALPVQAWRAGLQPQTPASLQLPLQQLVAEVQLAPTPAQQLELPPHDRPPQQSPLAWQSPPIGAQHCPFVQGPPLQQSAALVQAPVLQQPASPLQATPPQQSVQAWQAWPAAEQQVPASLQTPLQHCEVEAQASAGSAQLPPSPAPAKLQKPPAQTSSLAVQGQGFSQALKPKVASKTHWSGHWQSAP